MAETAAFDNSNNRKQSAEGARAKIGEKPNDIVFNKYTQMLTHQM